MLTHYWQPFQEIESLRRQRDRLFADLAPTTEGTASTWTPAIELHDAGDHLVLKAQLPGMDAKDLDIQVTREAVSIAGEHRFEQKHEDKEVFRSEFRYGTFRRVIPLPATVQNDQVQAEYKDGILQLTLPKTVEALNRVVKVNLVDPAPEQAAIDGGSGING
ncbi:MAG: Hsp20/alpha crystallin family protein [Leptolyngbyaceae cyanobacterium bins.59]|nr:Hsp20/alpha crystallin family protein [Leptolyngbyaceae cyanobacterium bins.59]